MILKKKYFFVSGADIDVIKFYFDYINEDIMAYLSEYKNIKKLMRTNQKEKKNIRLLKNVNFEYINIEKLILVCAEIRNTNLVIYLLDKYNHKINCQSIIDKLLKIFINEPIIYHKNIDHITKNYGEYIYSENFNKFDILIVNNMMTLDHYYEFRCHSINSQWREDTLLQIKKMIYHGNKYKNKYYYAYYDLGICIIFGKDCITLEKIYKMLEDDSSFYLQQSEDKVHGIEMMEFFDIFYWFYNSKGSEQHKKCMINECVENYSSHYKRFNKKSSKKYKD